jgi:hypothetical protein
MAVLIALGSIFYTTSLNEKISEANRAKDQRDAAFRESAQAEKVATAPEMNWKTPSRN